MTGSSERGFRLFNAVTVKMEPGCDRGAHAVLLKITNIKDISILLMSQ